MSGKSDKAEADIVLAKKVAKNLNNLPTHTTKNG